MVWRRRAQLPRYRVQNVRELAADLVEALVGNLRHLALGFGDDHGAAHWSFVVEQAHLPDKITGVQVGYDQHVAWIRFIFHHD